MLQTRWTFTLHAVHAGASLQGGIDRDQGCQADLETASDLSDCGILRRIQAASGGARAPKKASVCFDQKRKSSNSSKQTGKPPSRNDVPSLWVTVPGSMLA